MIDPNGQRVIAFASAMRNASRIGTYVDTVLEMFASRAWRHYETAVGVDDWRAHEFDYFLIAWGAAYADVAQLLAWRKAKAADIAAAMEGEDRRSRRPLEEASRTWHSPSGESLIDIARRNGWLRPQGKEPLLRAAPVPQRALARARHGTTMDEQARQSRRRRLPVPRRQALDELAAQLAAQTADALELRYVIDQLRRRVSGRSQPIKDRNRWRADVAEPNGRTSALMKRWGVTERAVRKRKAELQSRLKFRR
jgi:hypothetical protein